MEHRWWSVSADTLPRGIVAVDATREAAPLWRGPYFSVLEELAAILPESARPEIAFLGDVRTYPLDEVLRGVDPTARPTGPAVAIDVNLGRCPLVGPLMRTAAEGQQRTIVVLTNQPILDLDDWDVPGVQESLAVYRVIGADRLTQGGIPEWSTADTELSHVAKYLHNPLTRVRVGGDGVYPLAWDAPEYRWTEGTLIADNPGPLHVSMTGSDDRPRAEGVRANGGRVELRVTPCDPRPDGVTFELAPAEAMVLDLWSGGTAFACRGCGRVHPPGQVRCLGGTDGAGPLPTVAAFDTGTVCLVTRHPGRWSGRTIPSRVVELPDDRVLVWHAADARVYERSGEAWTSGTPWVRGMTPVGQNVFVVQS